MASRDSFSPKKQRSTSTYPLTQAREKAITEYRRQRRRVLQALRRQKARGLDVSKIEIPKINIKQSKTSTIKKTSTQLRNITPTKIRKTAKKLNKKTKYEPNNEAGFIQRQSERDIANKERIESNNEYSNQFKLGEITYRKMLDMIDDASRSGKYWGWNYLQKVFNEEINTFNFDSVMRSIASYNESEVLRSAELACYSSSQTEVMANIAWLTVVIKGTIPTAQESKEMSDVIDKDDSYTSPSD